jgi:VWFA-related protein
MLPRPMSRRTWAMLALGILWAGALVGARQTFRSTVDLIAVDVQVVDHDGRPVLGLPIDRFNVTIDGRRRRVISAQLLDYKASKGPASSGAGATSEPADTFVPPPRVILLAVDCTSFSASGSRGMLMAARSFVARLQPDDEVGLFAFPHGPQLSPTTNHALIMRTLDSIVGERDPGPADEFHLRPSELVDLSLWVNGFDRQGRDVAQKLCASPDADATRQCLERLRSQVSSDVISYEGLATASLGTLREFLSALSVLPGRKTVVLASAGIVTSDVTGGRPDVTDMAILLGKAAAEANVAVYTLLFDQNLMEQYSAETLRPQTTVTNLARDSAVLGRWLDQFSGAAGGALFPVLAGNGDPIFDRVLSETSAYYLLGVQLDESDRDGRVHQINVKVSERSVTVRGRMWLAVPKRGAVVTTSRAAAPAPAPEPPPAPSPAPRRVAAGVQALADLYERRDYAGLQAQLAATRDLATLLRDYRTGDSPWPGAPRRAAALALELALNGLHHDNGFVRDEAIKVLAQYQTLVRQPAGSDAFECSWYWTEIAGLESLLEPNVATPFVARAVERCPNEARFRLAQAVVAEQQYWTDEKPTFSSERLTSSNASGQLEISRLYEKATTDRETAAEARLRLAWFLCRTGQIDRALDVAGDKPDQSADRQLEYLSDLTRGQILRASGRADAAAEAFRRALTTWPGAQSARVALMTVSLDLGRAQEAAAIGNDVQHAPDDQANDPWWTFRQGDYRAYSVIVGRLRELVR